MSDLLEALKAIAACAGNLPDERLTTRTGANDAVARGLMVVECRTIALAAITKAEAKSALAREYANSDMAWHDYRERLDAIDAEGIV